MAVNFGPCSVWNIRWPCDVSAASPTVTGLAAETASNILWALTGRRFGTCQATIRPCRQDCYDYDPGLYRGTYPFPALIGGLWYNLTCGQCLDDCSCNEISQVKLPAPVYSIVNVKVDGITLVTGAYRLDDSSFLARTDGSSWPKCNDLNKNDTEVGTWSVTALFGEPVPVVGQIAAGELACEVIRAMKGEDCRLPKNVQTITRQGVTVSFQDISTIFDEGKTGLYLSDMFIAIYNPSKLRRRAGTYSIDRPRHRMVGT